MSEQTQTPEQTQEQTQAAQLPELTPEQMRQIEFMRLHFPFRIVWAEIDAVGNFNVYANTTRRQMNASARAGNIVLLAQ